MTSLTFEFVHLLLMDGQESCDVRIAQLGLRAQSVPEVGLSLLELLCRLRFLVVKQTRHLLVFSFVQRIVHLVSFVTLMRQKLVVSLQKRLFAMKTQTRFNVFASNLCDVLGTSGVGIS